MSKQVLKTLRAEGLVKSYDHRKVVDGVSIFVESGQVVGVLGPNGAGKTTCFGMLCGLIMPDSGQIFLDNHDVTKLPMHKRARLGINYLPQEPSIFRGLTVEQNIMAVLEWVEPNIDRRIDRLEEVLEELAIAHVRRANALVLSGGERRRVEIARSLMLDPTFILLDEPLAGIDPIAVEDIRMIISQLKLRGIGVIITDHKVRETLEIVDRAYILNAGKIIMDGAPKEIVKNKEVRRVYLGESFSL